MQADSLSQSPSFFTSLWDLVWPSSPTDFWALVTGISSIVLAFLAWRGLRSLRLAKQDMKTRNEREALQCTVDRCEELADELIPANQVLWDALVAAGLDKQLLVKSAAQVNFNSTSQALLAAAHAWLQKLPVEVRRTQVNVVNDLEAWALYFSCGLADHDIAFGPCARVFCTLVVQNYPMLVVLRADSTSGKFPNLVKLFTDWNARLVEQNDALKQEDLMRQYMEIEGKPKKPKALPDRPVGTDVDD